MQDRTDACQVGCRTGRMQAGGKQDRVKQDRIDAGIFNQFDFIGLKLCFCKKTKRNVTYVYLRITHLTPNCKHWLLEYTLSFNIFIGLYEACADGPDAGELCHGWGA